MSLAVLAKVKNVLDAFGTKNGTAAPDPEVPKELKKNNAAIAQFIDDYKLLHEFRVIDYVSTYIKKRREGLKAKIEQRWNDQLKSTPGDAKSAQLYNLAVQKQVNSPAASAIVTGKQIGRAHV